MGKRASKRATTPIYGLLHPACGPIVRVEIHGHDGVLTHGLAVLDTGASMSAIDRDAARALHLESPGAATWSAVSDGEGHRATSALRRADLRIADDRRHWRMNLIEVAHLSSAVDGAVIVALLGWDFLGRCRLVCDGPAGTFSLELPR